MPPGPGMGCMNGSLCPHRHCIYFLSLRTMSYRVAKTSECVYQLTCCNGHLHLHVCTSKFSVCIYSCECVQAAHLFVQQWFVHSFVPLIVALGRTQLHVSCGQLLYKLGVTRCSCYWYRGAWTSKTIRVVQVHLHFVKY